MKKTHLPPGSAPAFPLVVEFIGPDTNVFTSEPVQAGHTDRVVFMGLTIRDWFIAHAPATPWAWFNPKMPPCPMVPSVSSIEDDKLRAEVRRHLDWEDEGEHSPEAVAWVAAQEYAHKDQAAWQDEFRRQLLIQWPSFWADAMLAQQSA